MPGVYTAGTTGEFYAMEYDEWKAVSRATVETCKANRTPVMIGVTSTYTLGAQRRAAYAAELGADAIQVALPFWMEMDDREVVPFFKAVSDAAPGLALSVYETRRAKKVMTFEQHQAVSRETGRYVMLKANKGTLGRSPEGCRALSEFVNVFVGENAWLPLGPLGAIGGCSALIYMNPRVLLLMFDLVREKQWDALRPWHERVDRLILEGLKPLFARGCTDTALDRLMGVTTGFLKMDIRSRGTYPGVTDADVTALRAWMRDHTPELLEL
jgi:4-hydroxy-tetrahydrodipicolinate synthase